MAVTSAWNEHVAVAGTGTVRVPEVPLSLPSMVPCDHSFKVKVDVLPPGMTNVALEAVIRGATAAKAGVERATVAMAIPPRTISRSAVRRWRDVRAGPMALEGIPA
jgi:hypothetical protein